MKIVFMGTPEFAVPSLKILHDSGYEISGVVTVPDKPAGRGQKLSESAVKKYALTQKFLILQPDKLRDPSFIQQLTDIRADLFVVVAFRMLPQIVWEMPRLGCINLHGSLLPDYRGAAPIHWAVINGDKKTGVTTFFIEKEIDTGKIINQTEVEIPYNYTTGDLHDMLSLIGAELMLKTVKTIEKFNDKNLVPSIDQVTVKLNVNNGVIRIAPKLHSQDCRINWHQNSESIYNFIRGMSPFPCANTIIDGKLLKIFFATISDIEPISNISEPGKLVIMDNKIFIKTLDSWLILNDIQMEGKKRMLSSVFLRGFQIKNDIILGT